MEVVGGPLVRSRDQSRLTPFDRHSAAGMAYEDWNEIEGDDQDESQDPSVGLHTARLSYTLI